MHIPLQKLVVGAASAIVALLLARLGMLLLAADPAAPFVRLVLALTDPLLLPLAWLDAGQPHTGVRFERAPLLLAGLIWLVTAAGLHWQGKDTRHG